ncbi:phospholipase A1-like [Sabethes cyaneus]|uniref:phospholipase A1-like n=1 Tax=Sabethes cyaneus TaxID=53552 RepID=UPI00237EE522|nr:phospholipase A1-like [Sabethes cyaneus]
MLTSLKMQDGIITTLISSFSQRREKRLTRQKERHKVSQIFLQFNNEHINDLIENVHARTTEVIGNQNDTAARASNLMDVTIAAPVAIVPHTEPALLAQQFRTTTRITIRLYSHSYTENGREWKTDEIRSLLTDPGFDITLPTKILIHGWMGSYESAVGEPLALEFLSQGQYNVLVVDWENSASSLLYPAVVRYRVPKVAELVAALIDNLLQFGQTSDQIGIVGHSLGAHIAGLAGRRVKQQIAFISGLDPAGPWCSKPLDRLAANDSQYVEVFHSDGYLGIDKNIGTADYYLNGGRRQPGCQIWNLHCNHVRSVHVYKESLRGTRVIALQCPDRETTAHECIEVWVTLGGTEPKLANKKLGGVLFVKTAGYEPFFRHVVN